MKRSPITPSRHPRESGGPAFLSLFRSFARKLDSRFRGNDGERRTSSAFLLPLPALALLAACAKQIPTAVQPETPGFLLGVWHGFIFPVAWVISLFVDDAAIYAVPNNGGWYDFGYFLGIVVFGVGARGSRIVYRNRVVRVR